MSRKEQLQKQFGLTPLQAEDYTKAWYAIRDLVVTIPTSQQTTSERLEVHTLSLLQALHNGSCVTDLTTRISALLPKPTRITDRLQWVVKHLKGIRDNYLWPADVYPDVSSEQPSNKAPFRFVPPTPVQRTVGRPKKK